MKVLRNCFIAAAVAAGACGHAAAALTAGGAAALDGSGNQRTTFTNVETIALRQIVTNSVASESMIQFTFTVYNPSGGAVFHHTGNSARATLGNSNSQLSGLAISRFYSVPGVYKFHAVATLGADTVTQDVSFQISSPNINLIYPPYGSRGLTDKPLTFRWVASGASTYKITVGEGPGLYPVTHEGNASSGMYSYPENPSSEREQLVPDKVYYWKVEGLDATGMRIAESTVYSFSLKSQASSQSRNVAVTLLEMTDAQSDFSQPLHFRVKVQNAGGTNESNIGLKVTLSGMPAQDSPKQIAMLGAGETSELPFTAFMPSGQDEGLAVACVDIFDDNIPDNCRTKLISKSSGQGGGGDGAKETRSLSYQEMWEEVIKRLGPDVAKSLEGYTFDTIDCGNCSEGELNDVMLALMTGGAKLTNASLSDAAETAAALAPGQAAPEEAAASPEEEKDIDLELAPAEKEKDREWSGFTNAVKSKEPFFYTVNSRRTWQKVWEMLSSEEAPKVDFGEKTVLGVIAGTGNKAESVRIISRRQVGEVTVFDYYMTEATSENPGVPYIFKSFDKVEGKVEFRRLDVGGKQ